MQIPTNHTYLSKTLRNRREKLAKLIDFPTILWSGSSSSRNFPANTFPFRPSSHFLYFAGLPIEDAAIRLEGGKLELFMDNLSPSNLLWHGEIPTRDRLAEIIGADAAFPIKELKDYAANAATIYVQNPTTKITQCQILNRDIFPSKKHQKIDLELTKAIISLRLSHDDMALTEIKQAAAVT
ncbi:MAG: aminopeptidase P N-terminal domain-containing protein, partial [Trichodesmium sp. St11_bin5]|nr:aminopeptidase P N-terminal domain-containing protein [Trichodesmium sp. St11_bin5]